MHIAAIHEESCQRYGRDQPAQHRRNKLESNGCKSLTSLNKMTGELGFENRNGPKRPK